MFRTVLTRSASYARNLAVPNNCKCVGKNFMGFLDFFFSKFWLTISLAIAGVRFMSKHSTESDVEFDARYESFFNRKDIDGWECRKVQIIL